ncbi:MAG TPA: hypothetical protein VGM37_15215 [Armatimonadota bacterium]|jgi:hypothetical protein
MKRFVASLLTGILGLTIAAPMAQARANEGKAHNLAIGSTAAAAYLLMHKNTRTTGLVVAGASAYAWKKHHDAVNQRHKIVKARAARVQRARYARARNARAHRYAVTHRAR